MEQLKHIMVIFDEAHEQQTALLRGIELSRVSGANLHIVSVLYSTLNFIHGDILVETEEVLRQRLIERRNAEIDTILTTVNTDDINITRDILWTPVAHEEVPHRGAGHLGGPVPHQHGRNELDRAVGGLLGL